MRLINKHVFVDFVKAFVEYIKRILSRFEENMKNQNSDVLYNLCLNVLIALAEHRNYVYQFKEVLKLKKYGFDPAEVKYLNDHLEKFMANIDDNEDLSSGLEVDKYAKFQKEEEENELDNKTLADLGKSRLADQPKDIDSKGLDDLTYTVYQMVYEQSSLKSELKEEEKKMTPSKSSHQDDVNEQYVTTVIENQNRVEGNCDYKSVLKDEVSEILFVNHPHVNALLKDNCVKILQNLVSAIDSNNNLMELTTGTKLKKVRCLIAKNEDKAQVEDFDNTVKDITCKIINEIHQRRKACLDSGDLKNYLKWFGTIQNLMKECHIYSKWYPREYDELESITEFDHLWSDVTQKEIPELPLFSNSIITYIESNMDIKSDREKDKHLSSLMRIYIFLKPDQKKEFLITFCKEITVSFNNFCEGYNAIAKDKTNLLTKQLCVLDMILENETGGSSTGAEALKNLLDKKIEDHFKNQELNNECHNIDFLSTPNDMDKSMASETSTSSDKVEELRKMFEQVLIYPLNIKELSSQISIFEQVYNLMHKDPTTLPFFLLRVSELDQTQNRINANFMLHLSNIVKSQVDKDSGIGLRMQEYEKAKDQKLNELLSNLDSMNEDNSYESVHQNAYREMLLVAIECKVLHTTKLLSEPTVKKGVKFEIVVGKDDTQMIMDKDQQEEQISTENNKKATLDDFQIDIAGTLNSIVTKIDTLKDLATNIAKNILRHIIRESRCYDEISFTEEDALIDIMLNYISIEKDEHLARAGIRLLFDSENMSPTSKNTNYNTYLNAILQILNPGHMAKEIGQVVGKYKGEDNFDLSKMKALKRKVLTRHYCPLLAFVKDSKSKQEYLLNQTISTEVITLMMNLCSIQRLVYSYINLNASFLLLVKAKLEEVDGVVVSRQMKMLVDVMENPVTRFLNHSNIGNKCQNILNTYVSVLCNEMSPINILTEVYNTRKVGRIITDVTEAINGVRANGDGGDSHYSVAHSTNFAEFTNFTFKNLIDPLIKAVNSCDLATLRYFSICENSDGEENAGGDQEGRLADCTQLLRQKKYEAVIKAMCGPEFTSGNFDTVMSLAHMISNPVW